MTILAHRTPKILRPIALYQPPRKPRPREPRPRPARFVRLVHAPAGLLPGQVTITVGQVTSDYTLERIESSLGDSFRLTKCWNVPSGQEPAYEVLIAVDRHSCDCLGHLAHGQCKHVEALQALKNAGRL
jgi:hypothetical protein